jgi:DNA polymerase-1
MNISPRTYEAYKLLHDGVLAMAHAEMAGFRVDIEYVERKKAFLIKKMKYLEDQFKETNFFKHWQHSTGGKVNIHSNIQLAHYLYKVKKLKIENTTDTGQGKTDEEALKQLNIPELNMLLETTRFKKPWDVLNGFSKEQVDGIIHPFYNLHFARSFRSSSDSPNFQNIPIKDEVVMKLCRKALFPRVGHQLFEIDYSGIEVRINACINKDSNLIKYVKNPKSDMHADIAKQIFKLPNFDKKIPEHYILRQATKNGFVFPEFYGDYYKNCAENVACSWGKLPKGRFHAGEGIPMPEGTLGDHFIDIGIPSLRSFENHLLTIEKDLWNKRFPEYKQWKDRNWTTYKKKGYIDLLSGFRCGGVMDKKQINNYPGQGAAFHCLLWSFIELDKVRIKEGWDSRLIGQIHDSIIMDINPDELEHIAKVARRITCVDLPKAWKWIIVPLDVEMAIGEVDGSWADKVDYKLEN